MNTQLPEHCTASPVTHSILPGIAQQVLVLATTTELTTPMQVWGMVYLRGFVGALEGPVLRTELVACTRQLALAVLGSTGGKGNRCVVSRARAIEAGKQVWSLLEGESARAACRQTSRGSEVWK